MHVCLIFSLVACILIFFFVALVVYQPHISRDSPLTEDAYYTYIRVFQSTCVHNKAESFLFVSVCPITFLGPLQEKYKRELMSRKVLVGSLIICNKQHHQSWHHPAIGLVFIWYKKISQCTNNVVDDFFQSSLTFLASFDPTDCYEAGDGEPVDTYELPLSFFNTLVYRHTMPGDTVLDIHSGAGTCATAAFNNSRNCIVIEPDESAAQWISSRLRNCVASSDDEAELQNEIEQEASNFSEAVSSNSEVTKVTKFTKFTYKPAKSQHDEAKSASQATSEVDGWKCAQCNQYSEVKEEKTTCTECLASLHIKCAKLVEDNTSSWHTCLNSCQQVCIHTLPTKWCT